MIKAIVIMQVNRGAAHSIWHLKYSIPKEIPVIFHNRSNYDYYFIIKVLEKTVEWKLSWLGENTEKYKPFSVVITKGIKRMLLMVEESIRGGICQVIPGDAKLVKYWNIRNSYVWAMSKKLPVDFFKWVENTSQFSKGFIENYSV